MTKLGIKASVVAALMCVVGMSAGYVGALIIAGYVLLFEPDKLLRNTVVKTLVIMCLTSLGATAINLLPSAINWVSEFLGIFGGSLYIGFLSVFCGWVALTINIAETVLLGLMAIFAFKGKEFRVPVVDKLVEKINEDNSED